MSATAVPTAATASSAASVDGGGSTRVVVRTRLRLTRRGRAVLGTLAALPVVAVVGLAVLDGGGAVATDAVGSSDFTYVTVQAGSSLWSLAETVAPDADPRDVISDIKRLNALPSGEVQAGQRIALPERYVD